jgi:hypothetical protein
MYTVGFQFKSPIITVPEGLLTRFRIGDAWKGSFGRKSIVFPWIAVLSLRRMQDVENAEN